MGCGAYPKSFFIQLYSFLLVHDILFPFPAVCNEPVAFILASADKGGVFTSP